MCPLDVKKINYPWKCKHAMLKAITSHIFHHEWGIEVVGEFPFGKESYGLWKCLNTRVVPLIMSVPISLHWYTLRIHPLLLESQPKIVCIQLRNPTKFYDQFKHVFYFSKRSVQKNNRDRTWERTRDTCTYVLDNIAHNIIWDLHQ